MHKKLMKLSLSVLFAFLCCFLSAQTVTITMKWDGYREVPVKDSIIKAPYFTNDEYDFDKIPILVYNKASDKLLKATNYTWEVITPADLYEVNPADIPQEIVTPPSYNTIRIQTLKREENNYFRLKTVDIEEVNPPAGIPLFIGTDDNPLRSGTFYKIKTDRSGVFKITSKFLRDNGINPSTVDPRNLRIYGNGGGMLPEYSKDTRYAALQENAIEVIGEADGKWDEADYALFYAQGPHLYRPVRTENRSDAAAHWQNIYDDYAYYFISFDKGRGKRIAVKEVAVPDKKISVYDAYQFIDEEKNNPMQVGRRWVGDTFIGNKNINFKTDATPVDGTVQVRARVAALNAKNARVSFSVNGSANSTLVLFDKYSFNNYNREVKNINTTSVNVELNTDTTPNPSARIFFDYVEIEYRQPLTFNGSQMNFRNLSITPGDGEIYGFRLSNASGVERLWDVSDVANVSARATTGTANLDFAYRNNLAYLRNEFVAFRTSAAYEPSFVGKIDNQDLSSLGGIDYLVITVPEMMSEAKRLTDYHKKANGFNTAIVDHNKIYNEFSSGAKDITAIRDFVKHLKEKGNLRYVLVLGDTSYDYKNRVANNSSNVVPACHSEESVDYESSYVTDDFYGMLYMENPRVDLNIPDIPVGRLPAATVNEAKVLIDKTLAYYAALPGQSSPFGEWRMRLNFVVDDDKDGGSPFHELVNSNIATNFETSDSDKKEYYVKKLYLDAFPAENTAGGQRFPQVNEGIKTAMNNSLFIYYFGHGGVNGWAQERVLTVNDIKEFNNYNAAFTHLPVVSTITCEFTLWDVPSVYSAGEMLMKLPKGGPPTMITSSRALPVSYGRNFNSFFMGEIFRLYGNDFHTLGDAFLQAKKNYGPSGDFYNNLKVNYLGDPAMKLSRPEELIRIDEAPTKVRALDKVTIKGRVLNRGGATTDANFNGKLTVVIYDKYVEKKTLNNDGDLGAMTFTEEGNAIVRTSAEVVNGEFTAEFYVPKDINFADGTGRLLLYADNFRDTKAARKFDVYANRTIEVGGINPDGINDNTPPTVKLFMNNTNFADGGITNSNPALLACVTDDTGINATGSGVGHDITAVLDGEVVNTYVLNDFYSSGDDYGCSASNLAGYQKGTVYFPMSNLKPGAHQLTFKVWDINNNSATQTLNFVVRDDSSSQLSINRLLNWPNPFTNKTYIQFEHNCDDTLDANVQIFTITGKLVKSFSSVVTSEPFLEGFRTNRFAIGWDGLDDYGAPVGKGTYIYKVFVRGRDQERCKGSATQIEKMVILK